MNSPVITVLRAAAPRRRRLALALLLSVLADLAGVALMATAAWLIARAAERPAYDALAVAIVAVRALAIGRGALRYVERLVGHDVTLEAQGGLRVRIYRALARRRQTDPGFPREADLLSRIVADVELVQDLLLRCLAPAVAVGAVGALAVWFSMSVLPAAGLVLAAGLLAAGVLTPLIAVLIARRAAGVVAARRGEFAVRCTDLTQGAAELAVFGQSERALADAERAAGELNRVERRWGNALSVSAGLVVGIQVVTVGAVGWLALRASDAGQINDVMVAVLGLMSIAVLESTTPLGEAMLRFVDARAAARRVAALLVAPPPRPVLTPPGAGTPELVLTGATVRYPGEDRPALDSVDLTIPPGRRVAIIGPSGAGKSTLLGVLSGMIGLTAGTATLAGTDLALWPDAARARVVGGMPQDAHVFHTSIAHNLLIARPAATDADLRAALAKARLLDWLDTLPAGLNTQVGQDGSLLSGGQRQRLLLARAFLADPRVLLLDEPAESLDPPTADALLSDVLDGAAGRTVIVVTHRTIGLDRFDEILVVDAGRLVQRGTPADLASLPGYYRDTTAADRIIEAVS
jgi:ATP-binding cassette, subfamily C, bacterial CydC